MQLYITFCACAKKGLYECYKVCPSFRRSSLYWLQTMENGMVRLRARPKLVRWDSLASRKLPRCVTSCSHPYVMIPLSIMRYKENRCLEMAVKKPKQINKALKLQTIWRKEVAERKVTGQWSRIKGAISGIPLGENLKELKKILAEGTMGRIRQLQAEAATGPSNKAHIRQTSSVSGLFSELNRAS